MPAMGTSASAIVLYSVCFCIKKAFVYTFWNGSRAHTSTHVFPVWTSSWTKPLPLTYSHMNSLTYHQRMSTNLKNGSTPWSWRRRGRVISMTHKFRFFYLLLAAKNAKMILYCSIQYYMLTARWWNAFVPRFCVFRLQVEFLLLIITNKVIFWLQLVPRFLQFDFSFKNGPTGTEEQRRRQ